MDTGGWIKLHRKILDSSVLHDADLLRLFIFFILNAVYHKTEVRIKHQTIVLQRGQLIFGRNSLAKKLKMSPSQVRNKLALGSKLKIWQINSTYQYSIATITNYNTYQNSIDVKDNNLDRRKDSQKDKSQSSKNISRLSQVKRLPLTEGQRLGQQLGQQLGHNIRIYKNIYNILSKDKIASPSFFNEVQKYWISQFKNKFGTLPALDFGKDGKVVNKAKGLFKTEAEWKDLIDTFLASDKAKENGYTLAICFSTHTINAWKAKTLARLPKKY